MRRLRIVTLGIALFTAATLAAIALLALARPLN